MKNDNWLQVVLFSKYTYNDPRHQALLEWLIVTLQPLVVKQQQTAKKLFLKNLKYMPPIIMS